MDEEQLGEEGLWGQEGRRRKGGSWGGGNDCRGQRRKLMWGTRALAWRKKMSNFTYRLEHTRRGALVKVCSALLDSGTKLFFFPTGQSYFLRGQPRPFNSQNDSAHKRTTAALHLNPLTQRHCTRKTLLRMSSVGLWLHCPIKAMPPHGRALCP